jgi:hypothetical protein
VSTTPYEREILSHYYCGPTEFPRASAPAFEEVVWRFIDLGLMVRLDPPNEHGATYGANHEALRVYMAALDAVPFPERKWVMP